VPSSPDSVGNSTGCGHLQPRPAGHGPPGFRIGHGLPRNPTRSRHCRSMTTWLSGSRFSRDQSVPRRRPPSRRRCSPRRALWNRRVRNRLKSLGGELSGASSSGLCICRAHRRAAVGLLMDEPCSALDPTSDPPGRGDPSSDGYRHDVTVVIRHAQTCSRPTRSQQCALLPGRPRRAAVASWRPVPPTSCFRTPPTRGRRTMSMVALADGFPLRLPPVASAPTDGGTAGARPPCS